mgnify:CR=1 FL=1
MIIEESFWFLVQFKPNSHRIAEKNLTKQGFKTFLPMQELTKRRASRFVNVLRPLFPGYMFVEVNPKAAPWQKINGTIGISRIVSMKNTPYPVPIDLVLALMRRCDQSGKIVTQTKIKHGDTVKFSLGPFTNFIAKVEEIESQQRIWILLDFMSHKTRIHAQADQLSLTQKRSQKKSFAAIKSSSK